MAESVRSVGMRVVGDPRLLSVPLSPAVDGRVADRSRPRRADRPARLLGRPVRHLDLRRRRLHHHDAPTPTPHHPSRSKAITDADD